MTEKKSHPYDDGYFIGPIIVTENASNFKVKCHYADRELAKSIEGRRWNPSEKQWIYPKTKKIFDELKKVFEKKCNLNPEICKFEINEPKANLITEENEFHGIEKIDDYFDEENFVDQYDPRYQEKYQENKRLLKATLESQSLEKRFNDLEKKLDKLEDKISNMLIPIAEKTLERNSEDSENANSLKNNAIGMDQMVLRILENYPKDSLNELIDNANFSLDHYERTIKSINNATKSRMIDLFSEKEFKDLCLKQYDNNKSHRNPVVRRKARGKREDYVLDTSECARFLNDAITPQTAKADPRKLIDCANMLRNKLEHEGPFSPHEEKIYTIAYLLLSRIYWDAIDIT